MIHIPLTRISRCPDILKGCNLARSCDRYYRKFPLMVVAHNAARYDYLFLLRGLVEYVTNHTTTYRRNNGTIYRVPLLNGPPSVIFKNQNEVVGLTLSFVCPSEECHCKDNKETNLENRLKGLSSRACPFTRKIKLIDSFLFTNASLTKMVEDLHVARNTENITLEKAFSACHRFACDTGFSEEQFQRMTDGKLHFPYEYGESLQDLENQKTPPPPTAFRSLLKDSASLDHESWQSFLKSWELFKITSLKELLRLYNIIDR